MCWGWGLPKGTGVLAALQREGGRGRGAAGCQEGEGGRNRKEAEGPGQWGGVLPEPIIKWADD